jgi:[acyl-carrier-protein] S-malonyltransferase
MGKIAIVFSGQGAQYSGMGKELVGCSQAAANVFKMADTIRPGTSKQCFEGSKEELQQTENTQPCIFCVGYAAAAALVEKGIKADCAAGFSMGEVTALAYGGYLSEEGAFRYITARALAMQESGRKNPGIMFAVLGLDGEQVIKLCSSREGCYPVNFNNQTQISVSCTAEAAEGFPQAVLAAGGKAIKLAVSGGFHSPMMKEARETLEREFEGLPFAEGVISVYSNVTGEPYEGKTQLFQQIDSPVLWYPLILNMSRDGVDTFIEAGPGKTLSNMIAKILPGARILNVEDVKSLENAVEVLKNAEQ